MDKLSVIKIGGNIVDDEIKLSSFLDLFASLPGKKILIHGGGKVATQMAASMNIPQTMVDGRRITDVATLRIVTMVYAGLINKNIVAALQSRGSNALGLTGADGNALLAHKRTHPADFGFVGDIDSVNAAFLRSLIANGTDIVMAPITHDGKGQLLNTNADTIAQSIATALSTSFETSLVYGFERSGVLLDASDDNSVISRLDPEQYMEHKEKGRIFAGMIPKLDNAFAAIRAGVTRVIIGKAEELPGLLSGEKGTTIVHE
jgi:acetylglutamate kinase